MNEAMAQLDADLISLDDAEEPVSPKDARGAGAVQGPRGAGAAQVPRGVAAAEGCEFCSLPCMWMCVGRRLR